MSSSTLAKLNFQRRCSIMHVKILRVAIFVATMISAILASGASDNW
jgi:hypothetical protein